MSQIHEAVAGGYYSPGVLLWFFVNPVAIWFGHFFGLEKGVIAWVIGTLLCLLIDRY